jgi:hypothetical protein
LFKRGLSSVRTGLDGLELSMLLITLSSASLPL